MLFIYALRTPNRTSLGKIPNIIIFQNQIENQNSTLRFYFNINNISTNHFTVSKHHRFHFMKPQGHVTPRDLFQISFRTSFNLRELQVVSSAAAEDGIE